jgi:hypothetical protein
LVNGLVCGLGGLGLESGHENIDVLAFFLSLFICRWTVDFEMPMCKLYLLFVSADAAKEKEKKEEKVLLPAGVSKLYPIQYWSAELKDCLPD